ncbi:MAG: hypothetical protein FJ271_18560 [Planctomycetes bacterium]|nr:hypothetical protein [Planctomycetota bacterium]
MARNARRYDIYLPLTYNHGGPVEDEKFNSLEMDLLAHFQGLTTQQRDFPLRGIWQGETQLYLDQVIVMTVLDFRPQGSTRFVTQRKKRLLRGFQQLELFITEASMRVF